ncbi:uncharacterized protein LOC143647089 isoform X10 [Tamandua tetradactyla]|uniref:uncharacterized protein LOC143647089 isoform X10 n=1 Tax=Tamandua tetradactyla TaxID=48850 RepID=UPI0040548392
MSEKKCLMHFIQCCSYLRHQEPNLDLQHDRHQKSNLGLWHDRINYDCVHHQEKEMRLFTCLTRWLIELICGHISNTFCSRKCLPSDGCLNFLTTSKIITPATLKTPDGEIGTIFCSMKA